MFRLIIPMLLAAAPAFGHDWYHYECCNNRDCGPLKSSQIKETPNGWLLVETGRIVPYDFANVKPSKDDQYHLCTTAGDPRGDILCFYAPKQLF